MWFLVGTVAAVILQVAQVGAAGDELAGLLSVGEGSVVREVVEGQIPGPPLARDDGHDGQIYYVMALDPTGVQIPEVLDNAPYRYRRILFPALAGVFGLVDGRPLLWSMVALTALATGVGCAALSAASTRAGWPAWTPVLLVANPAMWLSVRLTTGDVVAMAFALVALVAYLSRRDVTATALLAAAALTKEAYLAVGLGLAAHAWSTGRRRRAVALLVGSAAPMGVWWLYVWARIGNPLESFGATGLPFVGLIRAMPAWGSLGSRDLVYLASAVVAVAASLWTVLRGPALLRWLVAPWLLVALVASELVWQVGNNVIRTLAPLFTFGLLGAWMSRPGDRPIEDGVTAR
jgi:hypothetical protein